MRNCSISDLSYLLSCASIAQTLTLTISPMIEVDQSMEISKPLNVAIGDACLYEVMSNDIVSVESVIVTSIEHSNDNVTVELKDSGSDMYVYAYLTTTCLQLSKESVGSESVSKVCCICGTRSRFLVPMQSLQPRPSFCSSQNRLEYRWLAQIFTWDLSKVAATSPFNPRSA